MAGDDSLSLVTVHPETNAPDPLAPLDAVLSALENRPAPTLITAPNSDPAGAEARRRIDTFVARHRWAAFRDTLGSTLYPNALRHAAVMVGNSSSGISRSRLVRLAGDQRRRSAGGTRTGRQRDRRGERRSGGHRGA